MRSVHVGLRLTLQPHIVVILHSYNITSAQLTFNNWYQIFPFVATCTLKDFVCNLTTFKLTHILEQNNPKNKSRGYIIVLTFNRFLMNGFPCKEEAGR